MATWAECDTLFYNKVALSSRSRTKLAGTKGISSLVTSVEKRKDQSKVSGRNESVLQ